MIKYVCDYCGWMYDPDVGDEEKGIRPGTPLTLLPEDWECPVCGASADSFSPEDSEG